MIIKACNHDPSAFTSSAVGNKPEHNQQLDTLKQLKNIWQKYHAAETENDHQS